jgi:hypothetical protein
MGDTEMIAYGWKYAYDGFSSETFPNRESAVQDLVARFPATAPFAEYLLTLERKETGLDRLRSRWRNLVARP